MGETQTVDTISVNTIEDGLTLKGRLLFSTVSSVLREGGSLLENHKADSINIDMSGVEKIDSAGITLLLAWKRLCDANNKKFHINHAQKQVISLITTNKLEGLLNLS
jgi:ABC-type transporter Mla MlaB component